jgi:hypothetical protein
MKLLIVRIIKTGIVLVFLASVMVLPGCDDTVITTTPKINPSITELSLLELWDIIVESTDIQESSAQMDMFDLRCDDEGKMDYLYYTFGGRNNEGRPCIYFAQFDHENRIDILTYEVDYFAIKRHPVKVFEEIDKFGLDSIKPGDEGMTVHISFMSGDVGYGNDYLNIFHLENGRLTPLDEIIFHSRVSWCTISVYHLVPNDIVVAENGSTVAQATTAVAPVPPGERTSQTWFLSEDINLAETVQYLEKSSIIE